MTAFNHFVGTECFKLKDLVFYFCALSIPLGDICNPIFARKPVPLAVGQQFYLLLRLSLLWLMLINASLWGGEEIGLFSHDSLQIMGLSVNVCFRLWAGGPP